MIHWLPLPQSPSWETQEPFVQSGSSLPTSALCLNKRIQAAGFGSGSVNAVIAYLRTLFIHGAKAAALLTKEPNPWVTELIINIFRHSRRFSNAPVRLSYQPRPNRRTRSDICIQLRYLRPVNGLPDRESITALPFYPLQAGALCNPVSSPCSYPPYRRSTLSLFLYLNFKFPNCS